MSAYLGTTKVWQSSILSWTRPADWLDLPAIVAGEDKISILHAVWDNDSNFVAFTISGAFTVDWGDGSAEANFSAGATAEHTYDYADLAGSESTLGYRQAVLTITPQSGQQLTSVDFNVKHSTAGLTSGYSAGFLDAHISLPNITAFTWRGTNVLQSTTLHLAVAGFGEITSMSSMFQYCYSLASIDMSGLDTSAVTNMSSMFSILLFARKHRHERTGYQRSDEHEHHVLLLLFARKHRHERTGYQRSDEHELHVPILLFARKHRYERTGYQRSDGHEHHVLLLLFAHKHRYERTGYQRSDEHELHVPLLLFAHKHRYERTGYQRSDEHEHHVLNPAIRSQASI